LSRLSIKRNAEQADKFTVGQDALLRGLMTKTPAEIEAWMLTNVTDLQEAREILIKLAQVVSVLARREFQEFRP